MNIKKKIWYKALIIALVGVIAVVPAAMIGLEKLSAFLNDSAYSLSRYDLFKIVCMSDEYKKYPYLGRSDVALMFLPVTYYFIGLIIACSDFLTKPANYFVHIYSRVKTKREALIWMKGYGIRFVMVYIIVFHASLYVISYHCFLGESLIAEKKLIMFLVLHSVNSLCAIMLLREIVLFWYCRGGVSTSFLMGVAAMVFLLIADMVSDKSTLLLYNEQYYFVDGIVSMLILYLFAHIMCVSKKTSLPC